MLFKAISFIAKYILSFTNEFDCCKISSQTKSLHNEDRCLIDTWPFVLRVLCANAQTGLFKYFNRITWNHIAVFLGVSGHALLSFFCF